MLGQAGVPEQLDELAHVATMFSHLRTQYEPTTQSEKQAVWGKLEQLQMKGNDFETLYTQLTMIAAELQSVGQAVTQEKLYAVLIKALPRSALPVIATIQAEEKTFDQAVKILRTYFRTQQSWTLGRATSRGAGGESTDDMEILDIKQQGWRQGQGKDRPICEHCRKPGHTMDTCWRLHPELKRGRPAPAPPSAVQVARSGMCFFCGHLGHTQAQCKLKQAIDLRKVKNGLVTKSIHTPQGEAAEQTQEEYADQDHDPSIAVEQILVASLENVPSSVKVQLDSAADVHLSGVASLFTHKTALASPIEIKGVNDNSPTIVACEKGAIRLPIVLGGEQTTVVVRDVLYVPNYHGTILSQGTFTKQGLDVIALGCKGSAPGKVTILRDGRPCLQATQQPNSPRTYVDLYTPAIRAMIVEGHPPDGSTAEIGSTTITKASVEQWHIRLGHLNPETVEKTLQQLRIPFTHKTEGSTCETCLLG